MPITTPSSGVPAFPPPHRNFRRSNFVILDNYGTHKHPEVKDWFAAHPLYHTHHSHRVLLAESDRTLVRRDHCETHSPWHIPQRERTNSRHRELYSRKQQEPEALRLDRYCEIDPEKAQEKSPSSLPSTTLHIAESGARPVKEMRCTASLSA